ncbi:MAG TPA: flagellar transcriptional regulator FlhC [Oleiagrimonas sp.]|nr:flagellar transcriptional regulator FlhC [Oleiagrimonas sp.]
MSEKSLVTEMQQVQLAIELIELGARLQVLVSETELSRGRLLRLYKEVRGVSPSKGMLPYSTDWFLTWLPNIHASLFYNIYRKLGEYAHGARMDVFIHAYRLYIEQTMLDGSEPTLGLTRAWILVRFFDNGLFDRARCTQCSGRYIVHAHTPTRHYVCGICHPPSRAGKTGKRRKTARVTMNDPDASADPGNVRKPRVA